MSLSLQFKGICVACESGTHCARCCWRLLWWILRGGSLHPAGLPTPDPWRGWAAGKADSTAARSGWWPGWSPTRPETGTHAASAGTQRQGFSIHCTHSVVINLRLFSGIIFHCSSEMTCVGRQVTLTSPVLLHTPIWFWNKHRKHKRKHCFCCSCKYLFL